MKIKIIFIIYLFILNINLLFTQNYFSNSFFTKTEKYIEQDKYGKDIVTIEQKDYLGIKSFYITTEYNDQKTVVILKNDLSMIKAYIENIEKNNLITLSIDYLDKEIVFKEGVKIVKKISRKKQELYLQREALNFVLRGYDFKNAPIVNFYMISFDKECYYIELSLLKIENINTPSGSFNCYKLLSMPAGAGKIFASKYKNYYYFTIDKPFYFIKYYNDFMPLTVEVVWIQN